MGPTMRAIMLVLGLFLGTLCPPGLLGAQGSLPPWRVSLGHGGWTVPDAWVPLRLELARQIPDARLELLRTDDRGGQGSVEVYPLNRSGVFEFPFFVDQSAGMLSVRLMSGSTLLDSREFRPLEKSFPGNLVLALGLPASLSQTLGQLLDSKEPVLVFDGNYGNLPDNALNLDAVSLVVMADPGPVLSPAQTSSLGQWLAGGGILVLLEAREGTASLASALGTSQGMGRLVILARGAIEPGKFLDAGWWQSRIGLEPFENSPRLSYGRLFDPKYQRSTQDGLHERSKVVPLYLVGAWALLCLVLSNFFRRRWLGLLLGASTILTLVLLVGGTERFGWWDRGLAFEGRSLVLPGGQGSLDLAQWKRLAEPDLANYTNRPSPWSALLWFSAKGRKESGLANTGAGPGARWVHETERPLLSLASGGRYRLSLAGYQSQASTGLALARLQASNGATRWQERAPDSSWRTAEEVPSELKADAVWLEYVAGLWPQYVWQAGLAQASSNALTLGRDGHTESGLTWIEPLIPLGEGRQTP